ncbi:MAG: alpha/beta hydrolase [Caulobacterales bacterium]|nr:alpha/beta hydrolase [Caulobacterales bacterium]
MALVDIGDAEIYVEEHGEGRPLLLVAGLGGRAQFWAHQVAPFAKRFRVILHDHRGVGRSTPDKVVLGAEHMADDLLTVMDALGLERAHLVGHSTGGAIGQHIALKAPERLDRLVLSCSWAGPDAYFTHLFHLRRQVLISCGPEAYLSMGTFLATPSSRLQKEIASPRSFLAERVKAFPGLEVELSRLSAVLSHDLRSRVSDIVHDTLCIGAMDDQITPPGFTEELAERIPGAALHLLSHGGHFCPIAASQAYNARLLAFLDGD